MTSGKRKANLPRPTPAELDILRVLWRRGPSTVRAVHAELGKRTGTGYTTVLKLMQIMAGKGSVIRNESERAHVYRARREESATQRTLVKDLMDRAFGGSAAQLVMQALASRKSSPRDLAAIRQMIEEYERGVK